MPKDANTSLTWSTCSLTWSNEDGTAGDASDSSVPVSADVSMANVAILIVDVRAAPSSVSVSWCAMRAAPSSVSVSWCATCSSLKLEAAIPSTVSSGSADGDLADGDLADGDGGASGNGARAVLAAADVSAGADGDVDGTGGNGCGQREVKTRTERSS